MTTTQTLVPVTDSKFITYLNYRGIRPQGSKREGSKVTAYYINDEKFNDVKHDFLVDKTFHEVLTAKHNTEELLRTTI